MPNISRDEINALLAKILETDSNEVAIIKSVDDLPQWDSLAILSFIAAADEDFGKTLSGNDVQMAQSVDDLLALVNR